jgi:hypothetical protein
VVSFTHRPPYPQGKSRGYLLDWRLGMPKNWSGWHGKEKMQPLPGTPTTRHSSLQPVTDRLSYPGSLFVPAVSSNVRSSSLVKRAKKDGIFPLYNHSNLFLFPFRYFISCLLVFTNSHSIIIKLLFLFIYFFFNFPIYLQSVTSRVTIGKCFDA